VNRQQEPPGASEATSGPVGRIAISESQGSQRGASGAYARITRDAHLLEAQERRNRRQRAEERQSGMNDYRSLVSIEKLRERWRDLRRAI
jgi:hypothetical protein